MLARIAIAALLLSIASGCASRGTMPISGVSVSSPYGGGTLNRIDSQRQGSPGSLYGW